ncbi:cation diffusion facilitator family transporter [Pseudonocardia dioxanivorans]|uniref:cation diffusion facilitator family transporter n=1 Tax=Pseudonocardia dioxanivorans TaxID=240495 RepID=UPI000CD315D3|nr:cation diffusion facilitator family transporter [Pseudonocardia dioxanivorans]
MTAARAESRADARTLLVSVWASAVFAVVSLVWGLVVDSRLILFDGLYSFASVGLSLLGVWALRAARRGPDDRYPWGREIYEPLAIVVKAAALGGLCLYALAGAVGDLLVGGRDVDTGWALVYAVVATAGGVAVSLYMRRRARAGSDLVRAEAAEWWGDALLSIGVLVGFAIAWGFTLGGRDDLARYVDPAMVALISAAFLVVPARLLAQAFREVLTMSPPAVREQLLACVREIEEEYGFAESFLRVAKVGSRLDVEADYVVVASSTAQTVTEFDAVRAALLARIRATGQDPSISVGFTADRSWVA